MSALRVLLTSIGSVAYLFILSKIMGEKQITQLSLLDYIIGISIGSIAAEMATNLENNPLLPMISMSVYAVFDLCVNYVNRKSIKVRRFMNGKPLILMDNGIIYRENIKKARMDMSDFLTISRAAGYFNISQIQTAVMEHSGNISFLPKSAFRPATPSDLNISPQQEYIGPGVILDGEVCLKNLHLAGRNEAWLLSELKALGYRAPSEVFYAFIDNGGSLNAFPLNSENPIFPDLE